MSHTTGLLLSLVHDEMFDRLLSYLAINDPKNKKKLHQDAIKAKMTLSKQYVEELISIFNAVPDNSEKRDLQDSVLKLAGIITFDTDEIIKDANAINPCLKAISLMRTYLIKSIISGLLIGRAAPADDREKLLILQSTVKYLLRKSAERLPEKDSDTKHLKAILPIPASIIPLFAKALEKKHPASFDLEIFKIKEMETVMRQFRQEHLNSHLIELGFEINSKQPSRSERLIIASEQIIPHLKIIADCIKTKEDKDNLRSGIISIFDIQERLKSRDPKVVIADLETAWGILDELVKYKDKFPIVTTSFDYASTVIPMMSTGSTLVLDGHGTARGIATAHLDKNTDPESSITFIAKLLDIGKDKFKHVILQSCNSGLLVDTLEVYMPPKDIPLGQAEAKIIADEGVGIEIFQKKILNGKEIDTLAEKLYTKSKEIIPTAIFTFSINPIIPGTKLGSGNFGTVLIISDLYKAAWPTNCFMPEAIRAVTVFPKLTDTKCLASYTRQKLPAISLEKADDKEGEREDREKDAKKTAEAKEKEAVNFENLLFLLRKSLPDSAAPPGSSPPGSSASPDGGAAGAHSPGCVAVKPILDLFMTNWIRGGAAEAAVAPATGPDALAGTAATADCSGKQTPLLAAW